MSCPNACMRENKWIVSSLKNGKKNGISSCDTLRAFGYFDHLLTNPHRASSKSATCFTSLCAPLRESEDPLLQKHRAMIFKRQTTTILSELFYGKQHGRRANILSNQRKLKQLVFSWIFGLLYNPSRRPTLKFQVPSTQTSVGPFCK